MSLKNTILHATNIRPQDAAPALFMFLYSFCLGIFLSFFFVPAQTLFLQQISGGAEQTTLLGFTVDLPMAFVVAGIAGIAVLSGFAFLSKRVPMRINYTGTIGTLIILMVFFRWLEWDTSGLTENVAALKFVKQNLPFFLFISAGPVFGLAAQTFGGLFFKLFDLRQGKWLLALLSSGEILAAIGGYFSIPFIKPMLKDWHAANGASNADTLAQLDLLLISAFGFFAGLIIFHIAFSRFKERLSGGGEKSEQKGPKTSFISLIFQDGFILLIAFTAIFSVVVGYMADFGFLKGTELIKDQLGATAEEAKENLASFIALFYGVVRIGELLMAVVAGRLINQFGMRFGVSVLPFILVACSIAAISSGFFLADSTILMFLFLAIARLADRVMRKSIESPSFKVLFQPLPANQKGVVAPTVNGLLPQISILVSGLVLFAYSRITLDMFGGGGGTDWRQFLLFFSIIPGVLGLIWALTSLRLFRNYKTKLTSALSSRKVRSQEALSREFFTHDLLTYQLSENNEHLMGASMSFLHDINPLAVKPFATGLLNHPDKVTRKRVLEAISLTSADSGFISKIKDMANNDPDPEIKAIAAQKVEDLRVPSGVGENIDRMMYSNNPLDKRQLAHFISENPTRKDQEIISNLLKDKSREVRITAVDLADSRKNPALKTSLVELISDPDNVHIGTNTLIEYGDEILEELEILYTKTKSSRIKLKIIEILSKIGTERAIHGLMQNLGDPSLRIQKAAINGLRYDGFQANEEQRPIIKGKIEEFAGNITWLYAASNDLESHPEALNIVKELTREKDENFELLFLLMGFLYGFSSINLIKENFLNNSSKEQSVYALELIDNTVDDDIKETILPLFEDAPYPTIIRHMQDHFPQQEMTLEERLMDIINRNYSRTSLWLKSQALFFLGDISPADNMPIDLIACLFNAHQILYETASLILFKKAPDLLASYYPKLSKERANRLREIFKSRDGKYQLITEKVLIMADSPVFETAYKDELITIAELMDFKKLGPGDEFYFESDAEESILDTVLVAFGKVHLLKDGKRDEVLGAEDLYIKNPQIDESINGLVADEESGVLVTNRGVFYNKIADEPTLTKSFLFHLSGLEMEEA